jgi:hypothetical protein
MNVEKQQQAKNLFFQSDLTKTQIAQLLSISRRTLSYWIREGNWNRLKASATHLPSILAENCYHMMGQLQEHFLSERRLTNPVTHKEVDTLHKLAITAGKLKNRSTLNESMEMFGFFLDGLKKKDPQLAVSIAPHIEEYLSSRAAIFRGHVAPPNFTGIGGRIPWVAEDKTEQQIDAQEDFYSDPDIIKAYADAGIGLPDEETISTLPPVGEPQPPYTMKQRNEERARAVGEYMVLHTRAHANDAEERAQLLRSAGKLPDHKPPANSSFPSVESTLQSIHDGTPQPAIGPDPDIPVSADAEMKYPQSTTRFVHA